MGIGGEAQASICRAAERVGVHAWGGRADEILGEDHGARLREGEDESDSGAARSERGRATLRWVNGADGWARPVIRTA